jgi:hypothetical protein
MRYKKDIVEGEKINRAGMGDEPFSTLVAGVAATLGTGSDDGASTLVLASAAGVATCAGGAATFPLPFFSFFFLFSISSVPWLSFFLFLFSSFQVHGRGGRRRTTVEKRERQK